MGGPLRQKIEGEGAVRRVAAPAAVSFRGRARRGVVFEAAPAAPCRSARSRARPLGRPSCGEPVWRREVSPSGRTPRRKAAQNLRGEIKKAARARTGARLDIFGKIRLQEEKDIVMI